MICPRCNNEWEGSQGACPRCGLAMNAPAPLETRAPDPFQQSSLQSHNFFYEQRQELAQADKDAQFAWPWPESGDPGKLEAGEAAGPLEAKAGPGGLADQDLAARALPGTRSMSGGISGSGFFQGSKPTGQPSTSGNLLRGMNAASGGLAESGPLGRNQPEMRPSANDLLAASRPARPNSAPIGNSRTDPFASSSASEQFAAPSATRPLLPGTLLHDGRYRLQDLLERQDWQAGVFEATWTGRDLKRGGKAVTICEVVVPDLALLIKHSNLQNASRALAAAGRDPHVARLLEAFSDQGRSFFLFERVEDDNLLTHLRRLGGPLPETDVVEMCWQMCETLDLLARQSPPIVHGLIRPEHIYLARGKSQFILGAFSLLVVIGATRFIANVERARLSPYTSAEFPGSILDGRNDLYALMATAYHATTGNAPQPVNMTIPRARQLNPAISPRLDAILARGLHPVPQQRYQSPSELRQDLLALRTAEGNRGQARSFSSELRREPDQPRPALRPPVEAAAPAPFALPIQITPLLGEDSTKPAALPDPESLPPLREGSNFLVVAETVLILLVLIVVTVFSNYHT